MDDCHNRRDSGLFDHSESIKREGEKNNCQQIFDFFVGAPDKFFNRQDQHAWEMMTLA